MSNVRVFVVLLVASTLIPKAANAQSDNPANASIQFDLSLPGARSLALGGAFVGVADDATAAWANPAGLLTLTRPELSIEGRGWQFANTAVARGHAFGTATGIGFDTVSGLTEGTFNSWTGAPSFVSFVYPKERFALAAYRHQLQKFRADVASDGVFIRKPGSPTPVFAGGAVDRAQPFTAELEIAAVNYGGSAAVRLSGGVSAGVSVVLSTFSLRSQTDQFVYVPFNNFTAAVPPSSFGGAGQYYGPPDFSAENVFTRTTEEGDDVAAAASFGVLWRDADGRGSAGVAYRHGPTFSYDAVTVFGPGIRRAGAFANEGDVADTETVSYSVPHVLSIGGGFRPTQNLLLAAEYDRVQYSRLGDDIAEIFGVEESPFPAQREVGQLIRRSLFFEDANQIRFGVEYSMVARTSTVALRFGVWNDPDHRLQFDRENLNAVERDQLGRVDVRYLPGEGVIHWTPGVGFSSSRFQVDAAFDWSKTVKTISASTVVRF